VEGMVGHQVEGMVGHQVEGMVGHQVEGMVGHQVDLDGMAGRLVGRDGMEALLPEGLMEGMEGIRMEGMEGMEAMDGMAWASELHSTHSCTGLGITQGPTTILPTTTLQAPYPCQPRSRYTLNAGRKRNPRPRHRLPGITVPIRKAITPMSRSARVAGRPWPRVHPPRLAKGGRDAISLENRVVLLVLVSCCLHHDAERAQRDGVARHQQKL